MKKYSYILLFSLATLLLASCDKSSDPIIDDLDDGMIEISYSQNKFDVSVWNGTRSAETRAEQTMPGTDSERAIDNLYILMFGNSDIKRYFVDNSFPAESGAWDKTGEKVSLKLTQAEAGTRDVYVIANVGNLEGALDGVSNKAGLDALLNSNDTPWSSTLTTPILMSGNATHNFVTNRILSSVPLTRALAKIELNVTLPAKHQDADASHYKYNFIDFDKNTYVLKQTLKTDDLATSGWQDWQAASDVSSYTLVGGKVATLKVVTYINERDNAGSYINIQLPYNAGPLPPPEFGGDTFKLPLPSKIDRNHWYKFDITL